jgi:hypothetical protein
VWTGAVCYFDSDHQPTMVIMLRACVSMCEQQPPTGRAVDQSQLCLLHSELVLVAATSQVTVELLAGDQDDTSRGEAVKWKYSLFYLGRNAVCAWVSPLAASLRPLYLRIGCPCCHG